RAARAVAVAVEARLSGADVGVDPPWIRRDHARNGAALSLHHLRRRREKCLVSPRRLDDDLEVAGGRRDAAGPAAARGPDGVDLECPLFELAPIRRLDAAERDRYLVEQVGQSVGGSLETLFEQDGQRAIVA